MAAKSPVDNRVHPAAVLAPEAGARTGSPAPKGRPEAARMDRYRYPATTLVPDYLRVVLGLAVTGGPLLALDLARAVTGLLAGLALLFVWFGVRTALRQLSWVELSPRDIALRRAAAATPGWEQIERLQLAYYAPRRARQDGWLQLTLRAPAGAADPGRFHIDGFEDILRRAVAAAGRKQLPLDPTTSANLAALGLAAGAEPRPCRAERAGQAGAQAGAAPTLPGTKACR